MTDVANGNLRQETVEFDHTYKIEQKTLKVLRHLLTAFVPSLGSMFKYRGVTSVKLNDVPPLVFNIFLGWLRNEYQSSYSTNNVWHASHVLISAACYTTDLTLAQSAVFVQLAQ
jgi:hypothetical protein